MSALIPPLFAFGFASPWLLGGLLLGGIPIVIHLLHRRRYKIVDWAAMRFLLAAARKNARRLRLEQLLLLAVRVLILLLAVLALSQPYVESLGTVFEADVPMHRVIVVDASFSMGHRAAEFTRFERAKATARQIVEEAAQGDAFNLARIGGLPPQVLVREAAYQLGQVLDEIERLNLSDERGNVRATLEQLAELLQSTAPDIHRKEVYILSDFQRTSWAPASALERARLRDLLEQLAGSARVMLIDVGGPRASNVAITDVSLDEQFLTSGRPVHVFGALRQYGGAAAGEQAVELLVDGRLVATRKVPLAADAEAAFDFTVTFDAPGEHQLEVRAEGDALPADNRRWLAVPVREQLAVLLVNGRQAGRPADTATHYLETVLAPTTREQRWQGVTRPRVVSEGELAATDLGLYDCVVLADVALLTAQEAGLLSRYVQSGGGLIIAPGERVDLDNYNQLLHLDGDGILPVRLVERRGNARNPAPDDAGFTFDTGNLDHPIVRVFEGNPRAGLATTLALEYIAAELPDNSTARVALRFAPTGDPAIVTAKAGHGQVVFFATSLDNRWGPWPLQASFGPIVHEAVRFSVSSRWSERQLEVGQPLLRAWPTRAFGVPAVVRHPDGTEDTVPLIDGDGFARLRYDETARCGLYEVHVRPPLSRTESFAVNVDTQESNLDSLSADELQAGLLRDLDVSHRTGWQPFDRNAPVTGPERGALTRRLLWIVLCLVFVEQLMAWRFVPGLALLCVLAIAALLGQTLSAGSPIGIIALLIAGLGLAVAARRARVRSAA